MPRPVIRGCGEEAPVVTHRRAQPAGLSQSTATAAPILSRRTSTHGIHLSPVSPLLFPSRLLLVYCYDRDDLRTFRSVSLVIPTP